MNMSAQTRILAMRHATAYRLRAGLLGLAIPSYKRSASQTSLGKATVSPSRPHKKVTVFNDDGQVPWGQLSPMEKAARTTQQSLNFTLIVGGALLTIGVITVMYTDVFSPQSSTNHFNRAVDSIRAHPEVVALLGNGKDIRAFGEATWNKWRRNRPIASRTETDKLGTERLYMHFNVQGPKNGGVAHLFMLRRQDENEFHYGHLAVDIPGHSRIYVEQAKGDQKKTVTRRNFLGFKWS